MGKAPARASIKKTLDVSWAAFDDLPVSAANAFLLRWVNAESILAEAEMPTVPRPAELVMEVGFLPPVPVSGTPEQQIAQVQKLKAVPVRPVVRLTFSPRRAKDLRDILDQVLKQIGDET